VLELVGKLKKHYYTNYILATIISTYNLILLTLLSSIAFDINLKCYQISIKLHNVLSEHSIMADSKVRKYKRRTKINGKRKYMRLNKCYIKIMVKW